MATWTLSGHAEERMEEMGVSVEEVQRALSNYDYDYPGSKRYPQGRRVRVSGRIGVVYEEADHEIITVIWHRQSARSQGAFTGA